MSASPQIEALLQAHCTPDQWKQLERFQALLVGWNSQINLVSRKDIDNLMANHIAPCFAFTVLGRLKPQSYILDIGSGGGLPGIINAILLPEAENVLVESRKNKVKVLRDIVEQLELPNVQIEHARVEDLIENPAYLEVFDCTTSRAVAPLPKLMEWSKPLLKPEGTIEALKGGEHPDFVPQATIHRLPAEWSLTEKLATLAIVSVPA